MNILLKKIMAIMLSCLLILISGCVSSRLANVWYDATFEPPTLGNVLVIAIRKDPTFRRIWEDAFAGELAKHGVSATPSYRLFIDAPPDTDQVIASVLENGYDGIVVILRGHTEINKQYIHGYTTTEQNMVYNTYWRRYRSCYREIEHPGYIDSQKVDIRDIDVTTTKNGGRLIWSATSRTPDPNSVIDVQREVASLVMDKLALENIINSKK